jgi:hypothetical protein
MVSSSKRIKTEHRPDQDEDEGETMLKPTQSATQAEPSSGLGDFAGGAILRIKLKNFVTYDNVDFIPVLPSILI